MSMLYRAAGRVMPVCRLQLVCRPSSPPLASPALVITALVIVIRIVITGIDIIDFRKDLGQNSSLLAVIWSFRLETL